MTEAEWLTCDDPLPMLGFLTGKVSERKLRLFAVACCRLMAHRIPPDLREAIDTGEKLADGLLGQFVPIPLINKFSAVGVDFYERTGKNWREETPPEDVAAHFAALGAVGCWEYVPTDPEKYVNRWVLVARYNPQHQACVLREIFGNPFRPVTADPAWFTSTALFLARQMYESRDFSVMPILADALQDAGCEEEAVLGHCRSKGPHVRGCWVVDLILGKE